MSDSNKPPKPPPDDFSKTTPNINIPGDGSSDDWSKTNYKYPAQPQADDWGNTVANIRPFDNDDDDDFSKNFAPSPNSPKVPDWGITRADINLREDDFGPEDSRGKQNEEYGVTTPYFRLPEAERAKYQNIPPTPTEEAKANEETQNQGIPGWVWISGTLFSMFLFIIVGLGIAYFFIIRENTFQIVVKNAPRGSSVRIGDSFWGETSSDGTIKLPVLTPGQKTLVVVHPNYECSPIPVLGEAGDVIPVDAKPVCKQVDTISNDCVTIKNGEYEKSKRCAEEQLRKLGEPLDIDALLRALNLYINHFDSGKADIRPEDVEFLKLAASYLKKIPEGTRIEVGGHTDSDGNEDSNLDLSRRRAQAVKNELVKEGVKESMLVTKGYGEAEPKADNKTADGKFQNRRIEYKRAS
ncbi:MAG: OmpA family protein [Pyrinomonadaceae bacterium]